MCRGTGAVALAEALHAVVAAPVRSARAVELAARGGCGPLETAWPWAGRPRGRHLWVAFADAQPASSGEAAPEGASAAPGSAAAARVGGSKGSGAAGADAGDGGGDDDDADDEDADEGADQDDATASQAVAVAKQVVEASKKVDAESSASRARLSELEQTVGAAESRRTAAEVGSSARSVLAHPWQLNKALRQLYIDRDTLADSARHSGAFHGRPFAERAYLERLAADADHARALLESSVEPARRALRQIEDIDDEGMGHAHIRLDEVPKVGPPRGVPDEPVPAVRTSSGCLCDPVSRCASAGQPFSWCHVHMPADGKEGECPLHDHIKAAEAAEEAEGGGGVEALVGGDGLDPTGRPHELAHDHHQAAEGAQGGEHKGDGPMHLWDYCVPPEAQLTESMAHPGASKTVHPNCRCAPRPDVLARYEHDPTFFGPSGDGDLDPNRVPFRDRITVEAMLEHERSPGDDLCQPTPSSSGWGVCPVAKECSKPPIHKAGAGALSPGPWFSDVAGRSWDFCVPRAPPASAHPAGAPPDGGSDSDRAEGRGRGGPGLGLAALGGLLLLACACCAAGQGRVRPKPLPPAAPPRGQLAVEALPYAGLSEEVEAALREQEGGTCLLSIAVGRSYIEAAKLAGRTKAAYAKKAGYRNLFFYFDDPHQFNEWCRGTGLGSKFQWEDKQWTHSTLLKYCAVSAAINENGCDKVLFTDADALIINFDITVGFDWPGASRSQRDGPHSLWAFAQWPEGFDSSWKPNVEVVPRDSKWCTYGMDVAAPASSSPGSCGSYARFASCLNTGVFVMDNSQASKDFVHQVVRTLLEITQDGCSTASLNPWGLDQCKLSHGDQCIAACSIRNAASNANLDDQNVTVPEEFMCLDTTARPRLQETYQLRHDYPVPHSDTFVVNCIGDDKVKCINTVMMKFPHLAEFADDDW